MTNSTPQLGFPFDESSDFLCKNQRKNNENVFDSSWRLSCSVFECSICQVDRFIFSHYLKKRPAIVLLCLVMTHNDRPVGCIVFSAPPKQTEKRYGGIVWELARLFIVDDVPKNAETWLISRAVKFIKKKKNVDFLVSYADPSVGHSGTIYRAANWEFDGRTDEDRKTPRCDYVDAKTGKKYGRRGNAPASADLVRVPRTSKLRFFIKLRT